MYKKAKIYSPTETINVLFLDGKGDESSGKQETDSEEVREIWMVVKRDPSTELCIQCREQSIWRTVCQNILEDHVRK